jgi:hypothetical protein
VPSLRNGWRWGDRWSLVVRLLLLLVLAAGVVCAAGALRQPYRQEDDLLADLAAGRVSYVMYERTSHQVHWVNGWWSWKQASLVTWEDAPGASSGSRSPDQSAEDWLYRRIKASPRRVTLEVRSGQESGLADWLHMIRWQPLRSAVILAWWLTFLLMLSRRTHQYANRWAWFWLFTLGQVGAVLYLVMEPRLMWRPPSPSAADRAPIRGGAGCGWSLLLSIAISLAGAGITAIP